MQKSLIQKLILLLGLFINLAVFGQKHYIFEHITKKDGLSQGTINAIIEDKKGFMWFGTNDGLNRYSGASLTVFRHNERDSLSLNGNLINALAEDHEGRIWISTSSGMLQYYDPFTSEFHPYLKLIPDDTSGLDKISVTSLFFQAPDILWAGAMDKLFKIDLKTNYIQLYTPDNKDLDNLWGEVACFKKDNSGRLWIGTTSGVLMYLSDATDKITKLFRFDSELVNIKSAIMTMEICADSNLWIGTFGSYITILDLKSLKFIETNWKKIILDSYLVYSIADGKDSTVWVGTSGGGVQLINAFSKKIISFNSNPNNHKGFLSGSFKRILVSKDNFVWLGNNGLGVYLYYPFAKDFLIITQNNKYENTLQFSSIRAIYKDSQNRLFIAGYGGLNIFDSELNLLGHYFKTLPVYSLLPHNKDKNLIWVGIEGAGLCLFNIEKGSIIHEFINHPNPLAPIDGSNIYTMTQADENSLWLGTENALCYFDQNTFKSTNIKANETSSVLPIKKVRAILTDSKKRFWLGSLEGGLAMKTSGNSAYQIFKYNGNNSGSISSNTIYSIFEDSKGRIFIGTHNGLNLYNEATGKFKKYSSLSGLPNDVVYGIIEDLPTGNLWLSTNEGLSRFNPDTEVFRNFNEEDGILGNEFNGGAYYKDNQGVIYFGGISGLTYFKPELIKDNPIKPKVIFTYLKKGNVIVKMNPPISEVNKITLEYNEPNVSIGFDALNFYKPEKTEYAYRLSKNDNSEWIQLQKKNSIELNQLRSGVYKLEVVASNNDNIWNTNYTDLTIIVVPPFWASWWFMTLATIIIIIIAISGIYLRMKILRRQRDKLEVEISVRTEKLRISNEELIKEIAERKRIEKDLQETNQTKDKFFSIISHDLRSPFNAMIGLSELLASEYDSFDEAERKSVFDSFRSSISDLYKLLQNLLTWSRSQSGKMQYNPEIIDLKQIIENNINLVRQQSNQKSIHIYMNIEHKTIAWADKQMIDTVVRNLLSNALKYTHREGRIDINVQNNQSGVTVCLKDSGVGMSEITRQKLFRIDEKISLQGTENEGGTGLGLILCKEFISINKGSISVESELGKGSTFCFTLPKRY
jgi:signal transduction histidine kinase/ligand-binding sensor domain-containing protein